MELMNVLPVFSFFSVIWQSSDTFCMYHNEGKWSGIVGDGSPLSRFPRLGRRPSPAGGLCASGCAPSPSSLPASLPLPSGSFRSSNIDLLAGGTWKSHSCLRGFKADPLGGLAPPQPDWCLHSRWPHDLQAPAWMPLSSVDLCPCACSTLCKLGHLPSSPVHPLHFCLHFGAITAHWPFLVHVTFPCLDQGLVASQ